VAEQLEPCPSRVKLAVGYAHECRATNQPEPDRDSVRGLRAGPWASRTNARGLPPHRSRRARRRALALVGPQGPRPTATDSGRQYRPPATRPTCAGTNGADVAWRSDVRPEHAAGRSSGRSGLPSLQAPRVAASPEAVRGSGAGTGRRYQRRLPEPQLAVPAGIGLALRAHERERCPLRGRSLTALPSPLRGSIAPARRPSRSFVPRSRCRPHTTVSKQERSRGAPPGPPSDRRGQSRQGQDGRKKAGQATGGRA
jgi:hypothetical protein